MAEQTHPFMIRTVGSKLNIHTGGVVEIDNMKFKVTSIQSIKHKSGDVFEVMGRAKPMKKQGKGVTLS